MKHIKLFEENYIKEFGKFYWYIKSPFNDYNHSKLYFLKAFEKIGCSKNISNNFLKEITTHYRDIEKYYLPNIIYVALESDYSHNS